MTNKNTDPIEMLADSICNSLVSASARAGKETAPFDKSYPTQIVGVNTDFISTIDAETRQSLILKFGLTDDPAENKYIIFINGEYYCCTSKNNYGLYEDVIAFAPNGDWSRLYLTKSNISDLSDAEDYIEGFYNPDDHRFYHSYTAGTGSEPGIFSDEIFGVSGILYFDLLRRKLYNYDADSEIFRLISTEGHGVGEWLDEEHTIERFNDYELNTSDMKYDHICGWRNVSDSESEYGGYGYNLFYGSSNRNYGYQARDNLIGGNSNTNRGYSNMLGGQNNTNTGNKNVIAGQENTVSANDSIVAGQYNTVAGSYEIVSGIRNSVSGGYNQQGNIVNGDGNTISGSQNIVNGNTINTSASRSLIVGQGHSGYGDMAIVGGNGASISSLYYLMIGNSGNIFTVDKSGNVGAAGQYLTSGADYGEYFEWADGNPNGHDRRGMIVMLKGDKIVLAQGDDFIGVISNNASVVGNCAEYHWHGKYVKDEFGSILRDENNQPIISDKYDSTKQYIPRSARSEWSIVGLVGRLIVIDDGSCDVGDYISTVDGIAVKSKRKTSARVLRRTGNNHIEILIK